MSVCGKVCYATRTLAADVLAGTNRDHKRSRGLNKVYFCSDCNASEEFHTSERKSKHNENLVIRDFTFKHNANRTN